MEKYRHRNLAIACVASLSVGFRTFEALFGRVKIEGKAFFASFCKQRKINGPVSSSP